jgi:selenide, water dikinase
VQTVDFFTPIVDSPYWFGQIAAANALSDIYAMGARPLTAMNLVAWPVTLGMAHLAEVLRGGAEKVAEAGADLAGGHSIDDKEPKYGLAVTGLAHPQEIVYNAGAQPGDRLVLTKRLGIGVLASALKKGLLTEDDMMPAVEQAATLNAAAARAMATVGVRACTDVSGFGLLGHLAEMLDAGPVSCPLAAVVRAGDVPLFDGVLDLIGREVYAGGLRNNRDFLLPRLGEVDRRDPVLLALFDPQTSGGLLMAVSSKRHAALVSELEHQGAGAWTVGEIVAGQPPGAGPATFASIRIEH